MKPKFDHSNPKKILNFNQVYRIIKYLGKGGQGEVVKILDLNDNTYYALKMLNQFDHTIFKEIEMLKTLSNNKIISENISKYYDHFMYHNKLCILMEYIDGTNADIFFKLNSFGLKDYIHFSLWLTDTIKQLHQLNYVHRDIKPGNIMVTSHNTFKLIDFGYSCRLGYPKSLISCHISTPGSPVYAGPELWSGTFKKNIDKYYKTLDMYAVGVTLYDILCRKLPYKIDNKGMVIGKKYHYITIKFILKQLEKQLNDILYGCVNLNPDLRSTALHAHQQLMKYKKLIK